MCGIAGWIDWDSDAPRPELLRAMTRALVHRGPDGEGYHEQGPAHLGHRRLSIIDLTTGDQPMSNEDDSIWIVFNGEIFNFHQLRKRLLDLGHRFKTKSDTETILHAYEAYGDACVDHLRGQFAFALWDAPRKRLFAARDRMGQKPFYYARIGRRFLFASELKSLVADPALDSDIDVAALDAYLRYGYVPDPLCILRGVRKLSPAHRLVATAQGDRVDRYWAANFADPLAISEQGALDRLDELLWRATREQMIADVPLGVFLSGGVDSSLITAYMAREARGPIKTFCIGFEEKTHDERTYARQVAQRFGAEHHEFVVRPDAVSAAAEIVKYCDEPFADESALPVYYLSRMAREHVTVALNGDGGDESFAGYRRYQGVVQFDRFRRLPRWLRNFAFATASVMAATPLARVRTIRRLRDWRFAADLTDADIYERCMAWTWANQGSLYGPRVRDEGASMNGQAMVADLMAESGSSDTINRMLYADQKSYLPGDLLVKVDRMTMAHGLEARSPRLDHELVDFAARVPAAVKFPGGRTKHLLKRLLRRWFPASFVQRRKMGFGVPLAAWFRGELKGFVRERIGQSTLCESGWLRREPLESLFEQFQIGRFNHAGCLWSFLVLEEWYRDLTSAARCGDKSSIVARL
jgi:asparagine synthase (glutamine-hydrolysing)